MPRLRLGFTLTCKKEKNKSYSSSFNLLLIWMFPFTLFIQVQLHGINIFLQLKVFSRPSVLSLIKFSFLLPSHPPLAFSPSFLFPPPPPPSPHKAAPPCCPGKSGRRSPYCCSFVTAAVAQPIYLLLFPRHCLPRPPAPNY